MKKNKTDVYHMESLHMLQADGKKAELLRNRYGN
jgi:hypothetical protein